MRKVNGDLPSGWIKTTLSEVTSESKAKAEPSTFADAPYIGLEHIEGCNNRIHSIGRATDVKSTKNVFQRGDVLYGKLRPYLKKVCRPDFDGVCSTDILVFPESFDFDNGYLLYFLSQQSTADYATQNSNGINLPRINSRTLGEIEFPLPPLAEQRRIVAKIEALQERSRRVRESLAEVGPLLEQFRQSVLAAAFRGDLTADWRVAHPNVEPASELLHRIHAERRCHWKQAELAKYEAKDQKPPKNWQDKYKELEPVDDTTLPDLPAGWAWVAMEELASFESNAICAGPFGTIFKAKDFRPEGIPIIFLRHISPGKYRTEKPGFMDRKKWEELFQPYSVYGGELLVTKLGEPPGTAAIYPETLGVAMVTPDVMKMRVNYKAASNRFLMYYLNSEVARRFAFGVAYGATRLRMNLTIFRRMPVPLAPFDEQQELALRIDSYLSTIDQVGESPITNLSMLDQLDQSILAKAFRGELLPQDPSDEPASALLARIREQKAQQAEAAKSTKKTTNMQRRDAMRKKSSGLSSQRPPLAEVLTTKGKPMSPEQLLTESGYDDDSIEDFYWALREEIAKGRIRENKLTESDVMLEAVKP